jgi:hypothetical protein
MHRKSLLTLSLLLLGGCLSPAETPLDETIAAHTEALSLIERPSCAVIRCRQGFVCEEGKFGGRCVPGPTGPACDGDEDCRLEANYCSGCDCVALADGEDLPKCPTTPVQCLVDPCRQMEAQCQAGRCVAVGQNQAAY